MNQEKLERLRIVKQEFEDAVDRYIEKQELLDLENKNGVTD